MPKSSRGGSAARDRGLVFQHSMTSLNFDLPNANSLSRRRLVIGTNYLTLRYLKCQRLEAQNQQ